MKISEIIRIFFFFDLQKKESTKNEMMRYLGNRFHSNIDELDNAFFPILTFL